MKMSDIRTENKFSLVDRFNNNEGLYSLLFINSYEGSFSEVEKEVRKMFVCTDEQMEFLNLNFHFPSFTKEELVEYSQKELEEFSF